MNHHALVCDAIKASLECDGRSACWVRTDPVAAISRMVDLKPNMVLLDLKMPVLNGLDVLRRCKPVLPETHFLVLSGDLSMDQIQTFSTPEPPE